MRDGIPTCEDFEPGGQCTACDEACDPLRANLCAGRACRCGEGAACDPGGDAPFCAGDRCVECGEDGHCGGDGVCVDHMCVQCRGVTPHVATVLPPGGDASLIYVARVDPDAEPRVIELTRRSAANDILIPHPPMDGTQLEPHGLALHPDSPVAAVIQGRQIHLAPLDGGPHTSIDERPDVSLLFRVWFAPDADDDGQPDLIARANRVGGGQTLHHIPLPFDPDDVWHTLTDDAIEPLARSFLGGEVAIGEFLPGRTLLVTSTTGDMQPDLVIADYPSLNVLQIIERPRPESVYGSTLSVVPGLGGDRDGLLVGVRLEGEDPADAELLVFAEDGPSIVVDEATPLPDAEAICAAVHPRRADGTYRVLTSEAQLKSVKLFSIR